MEALFLDVDGVVINSIDECYLISSEIYFSKFSSKKPNHLTKKLFYKYRGLVRPVYQYMILFRAIESTKYGIAGDIRKIFLELDRTSLEDDNIRFENLFFGLRKVYQADLVSWINMNPLTPFGETLQEKKLPHTFFITTKDIISVEHISSYYNIKVGGIFDKEDFKIFGSKGKIISKFLDKQENYDSAIFVDDSIEHLDTVEDSKIKCFFADWGYGENANFPVYSQEFW